MISNITNSISIRTAYPAFKSNKNEGNINPIEKNISGKTDKVCYNKVMGTDWNNLTSKDLSRMLKRRACSLPDTVSGAVYAAGQYIGGTKDFDFVDKSYNAINKNLSERIKAQPDGEAFKESYFPEVKFIKQVSQKIDNMKNKIIDKQDFGNALTDLSKDYLKTPINRKKIFLR